MLKKMRQRLRGKKGFTLMEMLIVVAIIAILVAIAIPSFMGSLDKAREATDDANLRTAKASAVAMYLSHQTDADVDAPVAGMWFDLKAGKFVSVLKPAAYGKSSAHDGQAIKLISITNGEYEIDWQDVPA